MTPRYTPFLLIACLALAPESSAGSGPEKPKGGRRIDLYGDPLPDGALARMGTPRLRHAGRVTSLAFSPDGKTLASAGYDESAIRLWEVATGKELRRLTGPKGGVSLVAFSPDGKVLASRNGDRTIRFWDPATGNELPRAIPHPGVVAALAFLPEGRIAATATRNGIGEICTWDRATGKEVRRWKTNRGGASGLAVSADGKLLASGGYAISEEQENGPVDDYAFALWDPRTGKMLRAFHRVERLAGAVAISRDGKLVAGFGTDPNKARSIRLWEASTGKELAVIARDSDFGVLDFSPDGRTLAAGGRRSIRFWDVPSGKEQPELRHPHHDGVQALAFSPDGRTLASCGNEGQVCSWDVARRQDRLAIPRHGGAIESVAVSPDGKTVVTGGSDGFAQVWEASTGKLLRRLHDPEEGRGCHTLCATFSPDGKTIALAHHGDGITLWDVASGKRTGPIPRSYAFVTSVAFSPDGKSLVSGGMIDEKVRLWDVVTGKELRKFANTPEDCAAVAFSPDGRVIAGLAEDGLYLWEAATGKALFHSPSSHRYLLSPAFSPDGLLLATVEAGVRFREVATGKVVGQLHFHVPPLAGWKSLAFSPDGRSVALAGGDLAGVWEVTTGRRLATFRGHLGDVKSVAFAPDGRTLVSAGADGTALVWDLTTLPREGTSSAAPTAAQLRQLWEELKDPDVMKAYGAFLKLRHAPGAALPFFRKQLWPATPLSPWRIARLIEDLDSDAFKVREAATGELERLGGWVGATLRTAQKESTSLEQRRRLKLLLAKVESSLDVRRQRWSVRALEVLATPEARQLLEELGKASAGSLLAEEANAALDRLRRRPR